MADRIAELVRELSDGEIDLRQFLLAAKDEVEQADATITLVGEAEYEDARRRLESL